MTTFTSAKSCCLISTFDTEAVVHMDLHHNFNGFTLKWILLKTCLGGKGYQHGRWVRGQILPFNSGVAYFSVKRMVLA